MVSLMFMRKNMRAVLAVQFAGLAWASSCHVCLGLAWAGFSLAFLKNAYFGPVWAGPVGTAQASPGRPKQDAFLHGIPSITPLVSNATHFKQIRTN